MAHWVNREPRIEMEGSGWVLAGNEKVQAGLVNLSRSGACVCISLEKRDLFDDLSDIDGLIETSGEEIPFKARICWSAEIKGQVHMGLQLLAFPTAAVDRLFTQLEIIDAPPDDTFNI